mgnify:CR=1 FL=1
MREHHQGRPRRPATANETHRKGITPSKGFTLSPPPSETGPEPLYRVVYTIDINAMNARHAAERAHEIMKDPQSMPPVLEVLDANGRRTRFDLSEE